MIDKLAAAKAKTIVYSVFFSEPQIGEHTPLQVDEGGSQLVPTGRLRTPTLLYADVSAGYWLFHEKRCPTWRRFLTGIAPVVGCRVSWLDP